MTTEKAVEREALLSCPFCGSPPDSDTQIVENGKVWMGTKHSEPSSVSVCHHCSPVSGQPSRMIERVGRDRESAIAAWNRRATQPPAPADRAEMAEAVKRLAIRVARHDSPLENLFAAIDRLAASDAPPAAQAVQVHTYKNQPGNVPAWGLGQACRRAAEAPAGDPIDRGLVLLRELQAEGFGVVALAASPDVSTPPEESK